MAVLALAVVALSGCDRVSQWIKGEEPIAKVAVPAKADGSVQMLLPDFTMLVEREGPAVVNIQATRSSGGPGSAQPSRLPGIPEDDPFYDFFRRFMPPEQQDAPPDEGVSFGSGFVISEDGYILTNAHVVSGGDQIKVTLTDRRELKAKLVGLDKRTDVAVLKVDAQGLSSAKIGNPAALKVGEWVAAIGAPFGFDNTVTAGIVSAKGRSLPDESYVPFIQTDVAINPGNSGGPLFNLKGEVVGINSQIYSRSGGFMGISFAIPIDIAMNVVEQLKSKGKVSRGQLGIHIQELTQELAASFGLDRPHGALVVRVEPDGAAAKAGVQTGDIVLKLNDKEIASSRDLPILVGAMQPDTEVKLTLWRKGKEKVVIAKLGELKQDEEAPADKKGGNGGEPQSFNFDKIGLIVSELTAEQKSTLGIKGGLLVQKVAGVAARSGLATGDVIVGVNQTEVGSVKSFERELNAARGNIALLVRRMDNTLFIPLQIQ
ncbi:DegQ family serine endoprotease [Crenobacter caeni]|uniref:Probable periplasmic serine endoprotease DegP-like n=1 Tax=Crenobacter caeni TaxID=2705474 RepID=A0A6B2KV79_9NEIS|nr:DegQ family serine endoprotease [Crenobacter caeni]NDV13909.1 DegQ family serine endoprotease [Crenobacter caeni]